MIRDTTTVYVRMRGSDMLQNVKFIIFYNSNL